MYLAWAGFELTTLMVIYTNCMEAINPTTIRSRPRRPRTFMWNFTILVHFVLPFKQHRWPSTQFEVTRLGHRHSTWRKMSTDHNTFESSCVEVGRPIIWLRSTRILELSDISWKTLQKYHIFFFDISNFEKKRCDWMFFA